MGAEGCPSAISPHHILDFAILPHHTVDAFLVGPTDVFSRSSGQGSGPRGAGGPWTGCSARQTPATSASSAWRLVCKYYFVVTWVCFYVDFQKLTQVILFCMWEMHGFVSFLFS